MSESDAERVARVLKDQQLREAAKRIAEEAAKRAAEEARRKK